MTQQHVPPGIFTGMGQQAASNNTNYAVPGKYWYRLDTISLKEGQGLNQGVNMVVAEFTVVKSFQDGVGRVPGQEGYSGHNSGDRIARVMKQNNIQFKKDVKDTLIGVTGAQPLEIDEEKTMQVLGFDLAGQQTGEKPLDGKFLVAEVNNQDVPVKSRPGDFFTKTYWNGCPDWAVVSTTLTADEIQAYFTDASGNNWVDYYCQVQAGQAAPAAQAAPVQPAPTAPAPAPAVAQPVQQPPAFSPAVPSPTAPAVPSPTAPAQVPPASPSVPASPVPAPEAPAPAPPAPTGLTFPGVHQ